MAEGVLGGDTAEIDDFDKDEASRIGELAATALAPFAIGWCDKAS